MALQGLDLSVQDGEMVAIIGNSGSGKSTLMNIIGGLDRPTAGRIYVNGINLLKLDDNQMLQYMRETVG
ncbi:MAG: ATP-binding cassette domain-containing protein, partial [Clostridia bacterium]|nr:ATP-binding cassette domain-containing protein [Clostridia bacterium]